ncbi:MAG TPA: 2-isopropylmalate synthase [Sphaerochaeta sp.]|nr:2-isopropylmalate synthase [Sphaerochaeta sp.]
MEKTDRIYIFDTTLRDGEQAPGYSMNLDEKIRMAQQLESLGVDILEAGFAIASPGDFASVQAISRAVKDVTVASLSRALEKDINAAWEAVKEARRPRIHTFLATSDLHLQYKLKLTRAQALEKAVAMVKYARNLCGEVEFSLEDATRSDLDYMCRVVEAVIKAGASVVNLPDTVGYATPDDMKRIVGSVMNRVPNVDKAIIAVHCHNDLGLAMANTLAGLQAGARQAECTLCGIGERAGNAALEEIAMAIRTREDEYNFHTNIKTEEIYRSARVLTSITGVKMNPSKAIVGANAFAHESGIHQHGMMANSLTYEIMTPESVGVLTTSLVLGKHSGQHAFEKRLIDLGYGLGKDEVLRLFGEFKNLADRKKTITDRDLIALVESTSKSSPVTWELDSFVVNSGNMMTSTACVTLKKGERKYQEVACGTGPVYASLRAVEKIIRHPFGLEDYNLQAVTEHRDALGEVMVKISDGNGVYRGRGVSTDVIEASILSCLAAVNRMLDESEPAHVQGVKVTSAPNFEKDMLSSHSDKKKELDNE